MVSIDWKGKLHHYVLTWFILSKRKLICRKRTCAITINQWHGPHMANTPLPVTPYMISYYKSRRKQCRNKQCRILHNQPAVLTRAHTTNVSMSAEATKTHYFSCSANESCNNSMCITHVCRRAYEHVSPAANHLSVL